MLLLKKLITGYVTHACMKIYEQEGEKFFDEMKILQKEIDELHINREKSEARIKLFHETGIWIDTEEEKIESQKRKKEYDAKGLTEKDFKEMVKKDRQYYPHLTDEELLKDFKKIYKGVFKKYKS